MGTAQALKFSDVVLNPSKTRTKSRASKLDEVTSDVFRARLMKATAEAKERAAKEASQDGETLRQEIAVANRLRQQS